MRKAVFFDKDGTLVRDVPYNTDPERIALEPGAGEAVGQLRRRGFALVLVSNQSGVARGMFHEDALQAVRERLEELLNVPFDGFYCCPHHPQGTVQPYNRDCSCRKPKPGLLLRAADDLGLELQHCWMVGDILHDVEAGNRAGCRTILLDNGHETEWERNALRSPDFIADNLLEAAGWIIRND
ncbi:D-glycero-alpha-D-manno-heptose-1,7-bisphosphate 7-phosphatase [Chitinophaga sp. NPDC101104]|uniref:D-glycero-alpha-D-manno-heptose-1,7-bisphosphate 7-phosphatase n=1 Tax=Chitinophaga sp. NPDC101104 TaxID=3390561 RepID=UPI003CFEBB2B